MVRGLLTTWGLLTNFSYAIAEEVASIGVKHFGNNTIGASSFFLNHSEVVLCNSKKYYWLFLSEAKKQKMSVCVCVW